MQDNVNTSARSSVMPADGGAQPPRPGRRLARERGIAFQPEFWYGLMIVVVSYLGLMSLLDFSLFGHAVHDSFTLMALSWRQGSLSLINGENYAYLELAIYNGQYYVSFPSVPALIMLPLTFIYGENTPNTFMTFLYLLIAFMGAYKTCRVYRSASESLWLALFMVLGCNLLQFSLYGGVWNQGQLCNFMFLSLFMAGMTGCRRSGWALGLVCLALAVGCRPFSAVYVPLGLWMLYQNLGDGRKLRARLMAMLPYLAAPAFIALVMGWYNWARFGNPLEFGHNYLPEFTRDPDTPQFALKFVTGNIQKLLRLPKFEGNRLVFGDVAFDGFAFWLANPIYVTVAVMTVVKLVRRKWHVTDTLLIAGMILEIFMLLMHKSLGGWQFGARYLCDLIPMMLLYCVYWRTRTRGWEYPIMIFAIAFNIYGAACFHMLQGGY